MELTILPESCAVEIGGVVVMYMMMYECVSSKVCAIERTVLPKDGARKITELVHLTPLLLQAHLGGLTGST
jgi:hypothetical protein